MCQIIFDYDLGKKFEHKGEKMINIFQPNIGNEALDNLIQVFETNWLGRGELVHQFEKEMSHFLSLPAKNFHTIASCSDAIFGVMKIFNIGPGDKVVVPSISFPAVGSAVLEAGAELIIADVDPITGNLDIPKLTTLKETCISAIFVTHYGGVPVDIDKLRREFGKGVLILEDAACALGSFVDGKACGTMGDFGCWSFDAMKLLTCGEGGAIYIGDNSLMTRAKEYHYLGLPVKSKSGLDNSESANWWEYSITCPGRRSVFTNVNAAIGLPQIKLLSSSVDYRAELRKNYVELLTQLDVNFVRQECKKTTYSNYFFTILTSKRNELANFLRHNGIYTTFRYHPLHKMEIFKKFSKYSDLAGAEEFSKVALNIPIHNSLSFQDVRNINEKLKLFFSK